MKQQQIFVSYSRSDSEEFALKLATGLRNAGANLWIDQLDIRGGENYNTAIEKALESATDVLIIVTEKSIVSKYVMDEVNYALDENKTVIPVVVHDCKLPFRLRGLQKISFTSDYEKGFNALLTALNISKTTSSNSMDKLRAVLRESSKLFYSDADRANDEGFELQNKGIYSEAIAKYSRAIELNPDFALAYTNRGLAYMHAGNYDQAIADATKAIRLIPDYPLGFYNLGIVYSSLGNHKEAITNYTKAIKLQPDYSKAYFRRGISFQALGNHKQAMSDYDKAIELSPDFADCFLNRGNLLYASLSYDKAMSDYDKAIELSPDFAIAYFNRGLVKKKIWDKIGACQDFKKACDLGDSTGCEEYKKLCVW